ncbi:type VI secretion system accessory protein TagJ [uncultured Tateyamaria sp.]|uniref:type VI secretion system accessory protein TagJ n=1 Tax=uncultured Tateyamaria sp. TaxID=455651 RepID=UPI002601CCD7|nr:type VI secretion system accessory protein TagJ [uncultured Tateyamaria sp.]
MSAETLLKSGDLPGALSALQAEVRANPADARRRVFLFQLLCVEGEWSRAVQQLKTCATLDPVAVPMAQMYREAIVCEVYREKVLRGQTPPPFDEDAPSWLSVLWDALKKELNGDAEGAERLRSMSLRAAPATAGSANGTSFDWIADADPRFGPVLELIVDGKYLWLPFAELRGLKVHPPRDLRDVVWTPVTLTLVNGTESIGLIPTRYPNTHEHGTPVQKLARATDWSDPDGITPRGLGQRMFCTEADNLPLMELREVTFHHADTPANQSLKQVSHG